jgi:hypothetical protein
MPFLRPMTILAATVTGTPARARTGGRARRRTGRHGPDGHRRPRRLLPASCRRTLDREVPGYLDSWYQREAEWEQRTRELNALSEANADRYNPGLVAQATAEIAARGEVRDLGLHGDMSRVLADARTIGEACYLRGDANRYFIWYEGSSTWTPSLRVTVTCGWDPPDGS